MTEKAKTIKAEARNYLDNLVGDYRMLQTSMERTKFLTEKFGRDYEKGLRVLKVWDSMLNQP
jgi:hypothetical protein